MTYSFHLKTTDPEEFQERVSPLAGALRVRPARKGPFAIAIRAAQLDKMNLFTVKTPSIRVQIAPPHEYFCLNIPLGKPFSITEFRQRYDFSDQVHLLMPDRHLDLEAVSDCRVLAVKLNSERVLDCGCKLNGFPGPFESAIKNRRPDSLTGYCAFVRGLARLWSDLQRENAPLDMAINIAEREDALFTHFVLAMQGEEKTRAREQADTTSIARAEEYLLARLTQPVSRAELAAASGISIRTLSRGFAKRWGIGPMRFLKTQRMEAAYRDLLGAEPGATSVTEVAFRYGLTHLGKFAGEYRRAFHESPSETLRH